MSFYIFDSPEVAEYMKSVFNSSEDFYFVDQNKNVMKNRIMFDHGCKIFLEKLKLALVPEYKLHPKHGFVPAYYNDDFLDSAPESWSSPESPKKHETKQQNEKRDQKEENENMNLKENFPYVGQHVWIKNNQDYHISGFGENFIGLKVTVMSKFTIPSKEDGDINTVAVMANEITGFGKNICCCFREDMCHPVKTEREKEIENLLDLICKGGTVNDIAARLYNEGYRKQKD